MALRRRDNKQNKNGRASAGQTSSGRVRDPGFYDLRDPAGYGLREQDRRAAGIPAGEPAADERPYRERHRVEVRHADRDRRESVYGDRYSTGPDADLFPPVRGSRQPDRRNDESRGRAAELPSFGQDPAEPRRRVVRGNSPGERRSSSYSIPGSSVRERYPQRRQDLSADLFVPQGSGRNSGRSYRAADPPSWRQRAEENRRAYSGSDGLPVRRTSADSSYRAGSSYRGRNTRPVSSPVSSGSIRPDPSRRADGKDYSRFQPDPRFSSRTAVPGTVSPEEADLPEERQDGGGTSQREIRRRQLRRQREKQLRRTYMKIGAGIFAAILVLALLIFAVAGLLRRGRKAGEGEANQAAAQVQPETAVQEQDGSGADSGGERELPAAEAEQPASEKNGEQASGPEEGNSPAQEVPQPEGETLSEQETSQPEETEADLNGEAEENTPAETDPTDSTDPEGNQTPSAEQAEAGTGPAASGNSGAGQTYLDPNDWRLILVNTQHTLPENYSVETTTLPNGESVDSRCYQALIDMLEDCRAAGGTPIVCSSYRPHEKQVKLFEEQVASLTAKGLSRKEAEKEAGTAVAVPGTSEHELGLAVDICDTYNQLLDASQADTPTQRWLMIHCWEYGFILRYPENKTEITGIIYEPWHYRYVGAEAALQIRDRGICLEEYLAQN